MESIMTSRQRVLWFAAAVLSLASSVSVAQCEDLQRVTARQRDNLTRLLPCLRDPACSNLVATEDLGRTCRSTTHVWARSADGRFVVIRDLKMCEQPGAANDPRFVHGLAIPLARVVGVEDQQLTAAPEQNGIWQLAWDAALAKGLAEDEIALVANPPGNRSQNQLHIHVVRRNGAALPPTIELADLSDVWQRAAAAGRDIACRNYGILVHKSGGKFRLLVEPGDANPEINPESRYTLERR
jgi:CDP-diacylglycerol pyrophosphatase